MTFDEFLKKYKTGESCSFNKTYRGECVSLVKNYIKEVLGAEPLSIGNAKEYWNKRYGKYISSLFTPIENHKGFIPKRGDVFVRTSGTYGHIGIVISASEKELITIEQNFNGCRTIKRIVRTNRDNLNYLRPKNKKNILVPPTVKSGVYKLTNVRGIYNGWGSATKRKKVKDISENAKQNAVCKKNNAEAFLLAGTKVSIENTKRLGSGNLWAKIPSGYICIWEEDKDKIFLKK
ncbi:MAG: CHAP domain-containing protein [Eubacterium sp.]|nr:CHAP domain-containing protein [Eubacterium sp.]